MFCVTIVAKGSGLVHVHFVCVTTSSNMYVYVNFVSLPVKQAILVTVFILAFS